MVNINILFLNATFTTALTLDMLSLYLVAMDCNSRLGLDLRYPLKSSTMIKGADRQKSSTNYNFGIESAGFNILAS